MLTTRWKTSPPLFSFTYGGEQVVDRLPHWQLQDRRSATAGGETVTVTYRDPRSGLKLRHTLRHFDETGALDLLVELVNEGTADTPLIEDLWPLDLHLAVAATDQVELHHARGSLCQLDDFLPLHSELPSGASLALQPVGGRSSNGTLPFMNLQLPGGGIVIAVGWSGQWAVNLARDDEGLRVTAGMERTRFYLKPGETVRTPRLLLIPWQGEQPEIGANLLRRLLLRYYVPHDEKGPSLPPLAFNSMMSYYSSGTTSETEQLRMLDQAHRLDLEAFWVDACWYGTVGDSSRSEDNWSSQVGNWFYNRRTFPNGLQPIGEAAAKRGMKFVLWFEPERVRPGTLVAQRLADRLLKTTEAGPAGVYLVNLGEPTARQFLTELISGIIGEARVTLYRQDCNIDPLPYWRAAEAEDRQGITEMKYVAGLYDFWDELRRRHPGLTIDNCASGGRRIDLETVSRSYPLWRSDFSDVGGPRYGLGMHVGDQVANLGLSRWVPLHTGPVWSLEPYKLRGTMATGIVLYGDIYGFPSGLTEQALAELRRLRPLMSGDFYLLAPLNTSYHDWCAYQYHDPGREAGFAVFLRRHESPYPVLETALQGVRDETEYDVFFSEGYSVESSCVQDGDGLRHLSVTIDQRPGSLLLEYRKRQ